MALLERGATLEGYRIESMVGKGGMGVVYRATQVSLDRIVALKVLSAELSQDPAFQARFRREGQLQATLDHSSIVTVYEAGESELGLFLAMRFIEGPNLKELVLSGSLDPARTVQILGQVGDAIDAAHEVGLIHRDIKPQNVLVDERRGDRAYLADFGITKSAGGQGMTRTGELVGTLDYIAPELFEGGSATERSDIYALAATLYECLGGSVPYPRDGDAAVIYAHLSERPPTLTASGLPSAVDPVIDQGMARSPADRYASAGELMDDAAIALGDTTARRSRPTVVDQPKPNTEATLPLHGRSRRTAIAAAAGITLILVAAGFGVGWATSGGDDGQAKAAVGDLEVEVPKGWRRLASQPSVEGLAFTRALGLAPADDRGTPAVVAGDLAGRPAQRLLRGGQLVQLGELEAYRFRGSPQLYVIPGARSDAAVACVDPSTQAMCGRIAATLSTGRPSPATLSGRIAFATAVQGIVRRLNTAVADNRPALIGPSAEGQAAAASSMAGAYRDAARQVRDLSVASDVNDDRDALADALADVEARYQVLATAGFRGDEAAWAAAGRRASSAEEAALRLTTRATAILRRPSL